MEWNFKTWNSKYIDLNSGTKIRKILLTIKIIWKFKGYQKLNKKGLLNQKYVTVKLAPNQLQCMDGNSKKIKMIKKFGFCVIRKSFFEVSFPQ